jgi:hypothetical protein
MPLDSAEFPIGTLADLAVEGIRKSFEQMLRERLQAQVDPIVSQIARDISDQMLVNLKHARLPHGSSGFGPEIVVHLAFNSKDVVYTAQNKDSIS